MRKLKLGDAVALILVVLVGFVAGILVLAVPHPCDTNAKFYRLVREGPQARFPVGRSITFGLPPGGGLCWCYPQSMKPADNRPAQIRQEAAASHNAQIALRRATFKLIAVTVLLVAWLGLGVLVAASA